jgi:hypothetical protein
MCQRHDEDQGEQDSPGTYKLLTSTARHDHGIGNTARIPCHHSQYVPMTVEKPIDRQATSSEAARHT